MKDTTHLINQFYEEEKKNANETTYPLHSSNKSININFYIKQIKETERAKESNLMITVHKLLLAKTDKLPGGKEVSTFQGTSCTKTPTWSARTLFKTITETHT